MVEQAATAGCAKVSYASAREAYAARVAIKTRKRRDDGCRVYRCACGAWHLGRHLELARLQDLPAEVDGAPLKLCGDNVGAWIERVGNAVPVGAAQAIAEQMLITLLSSDVGAGLAVSGGKVWVERADAEALQ